VFEFDEENAMNKDVPMDTEETRGETIDFAARFAGSETFRTLFREGMALVEETASYLDGPGRAESRGLSRAASLIYATESMRLTTRLMQLASWLLLQRAVNEGEMTQQQAGLEKSKVRIEPPASDRSGPGWDEVPEALRALVDRSKRLQDRIRRLDDAIYTEGKPPVAEPAANPVADQLGLLTRAFGDKG
jgi:regulator of CtrA degradation